MCRNIICIIAVTLLPLLLIYITCLGYFRLSVYTWGIFIAYIHRQLSSHFRSSIFREAGRDSNVESKNNHDVEEAPDFSFSWFLVNTVPSNLNTGHSCMSKCTARLIIAYLTMMKYIEYVTLYKFYAFVNLNNCDLSQHVMYILQTTPKNH